MIHASRMLLCVAALCVLLPALAWTEPPPGGPPPGMLERPGMLGPPTFMTQVFPPELVMRSQSALNLTSAQLEAMTHIMAETQAQLVVLQWKVEAAMQALTHILEKDVVDEEAALAQWDQLSDGEQQIKKAHLRLLIRIKNQLTPSQQEQLRALRSTHLGPPFRHRPGE